MSKFADALSTALPSQRSVADFYESGDMDTLADYTGDDSLKFSIEEGEDLDLSPEPADDEETVTPEENQEVDPLAQIVGTNVDLTPVGEDDVTPQEDKNIDNMMDVAATPVLLSTADEKELEEFVESTEIDLAVSEGFLPGSQFGDVYLERSIVKLDKKARKDQLYITAVNAIAQEKKDPLFKKLKLVHKMKRTLQGMLAKKYHALALRKMKEYLARARKSKSKTLSNASKKLTNKKK